MSRCESSAAGLRRMDVTAARLTAEGRGGGRGLGRVLGGDVEAARAVEAAGTVSPEVTAAPETSTRNRDICIVASVVVGMFLVVGVIVAIDPFN